MTQSTSQLSLVPSEIKVKKCFDIYKSKSYNEILFSQSIRTRKSISKFLIMWITKPEFVCFYSILQHRCNILTCPHFPVDIRDIHKWNTYLYTPLGCAVHHLACTTQAGGGMQEWDKCLYLLIWGSASKNITPVLDFLAKRQIFLAPGKNFNSFEALNQSMKLCK